MATLSNPLPPVRKAERVPTPPKPSSEANPFKPIELTKTIKSTNTNVHNTAPPLPATPHFINSVTELRSLSTALSAFLRRYDELQGHLDFIKTSIDSKLPEQLPLLPLPETSSSTAAKTSVPETTNSTNHCEQKPDEQKPTRSELESYCETMCSRSVRRYVITHLSEVNKLREEVPKALKFAPDPAKLVLESIGRFYMQGRKAYAKDSPMIAGREASVLMLEFFLLMGCEVVEIANAVVEEAMTGAVAWRSRINTEGGLAKAAEIDARGLLLLISCFGIPAVFGNEDIRDLIRASNAKGISGALRRSIVLIPKIPEIIEWMVKNKMEIEAVDIAYTFGLEDRCSPRTILTTFLRKRTKSRAQDSSAEVKEANKKQLADLKSAMKCLEAHKIDPSKLLPEFKINEKILGLEKDMAQLDKKAEEKAKAKRKAGETVSSKNLKTQDVKRSRLTGHNVPHEHKAAGQADGKSFYNGLTQTNSFLDGGFPGNYISTYSASSSVLHGSGLPENVTGSIAAGAGLSGGGLTASLYAGVHGGTVVDTVGQMVNHSNGQPYGWHGDAALNERLSGKIYAPQSSFAGLIGSYRSSASSLEGFVGMPNRPTSVGVSAPHSSSDLYQFADSVLDSESYHTSGSRAGGDTMHSVLPARHYLY